MTTSNSPIERLRMQATNIAARLKAVERGDNVAGDPFGKKLKASLARGTVKFAVMMDDKTIAVEMTWAEIRRLDEAVLAEWLLEYMRHAPRQ